MNVGLLTSAMAMTSSEKDFVSRVKTWLAPFLGGVAASALSTPQLVGVLRGESSAPAWLQKPIALANAWASKVDDQALLNLVNLINKDSIDPVLSLAKRFGDHLNLPEATIDQDSLIRNVRFLLGRADSLSGMFQPQAICICPKCKFTFLNLKEE